MCFDYSVFNENTYEDLYLLNSLVLLMEQHKVNVRGNIEVDAPVVLVKVKVILGIEVANRNEDLVPVIMDWSTCIDG